MIVTIILILILFSINFYILFKLLPNKFNEIKEKIIIKKKEVELNKVIKEDKCCPNEINKNLIISKIQNKILPELDLKNEIIEIIDDKPNILEPNSDFNYINDDFLNFEKKLILNEKLYGNKNKGLNVNGNLIITGNLDIDGNIENSKLEFKLLQYLPIGKIIFWNSENIPNGWALCDGKRYKIGTGPAEECNDGTCNDDNSILTPNLINRFLLGKTETGNLGRIGGDNHELKFENIPMHSHTYDKAKRISKATLDDDDQRKITTYEEITSGMESSNNEPIDKNKMIPEHYTVLYLIKICY